MRKILYPIITLLLLSGCSVFQSDLIKRRALKKGMSQIQVKRILGKPNRAKFVDGHLVYKYYQYLERKEIYRPYYLVFDGKNELRRWYMSFQEYRLSQATWGRYKTDIHDHWYERIYPDSSSRRYR